MTLPRSSIIGVLGAALLLALAVSAPQAQERIRLTGWVQWMSSGTLQLMTVSGASIAVDLRDADQSSYQALRTGEMVIIDGVVSADRRRVVAREIRRDMSGGEAP